MKKNALKIISAEKNGNKQYDLGDFYSMKKIIATLTVAIVFSFPSQPHNLCTSIFGIQFPGNKTKQKRLK